MRHLRPAFELRQRWHYTNQVCATTTLFSRISRVYPILQMYTLGAHLIATYSGMPYPEFVSARIFKPLGMSSTTYSAKEASKNGLLTQAWTKFGRRIPFWASDDLVDVLAGPGGVISSVVDMVSAKSKSSLTDDRTLLVLLDQMAQLATQWRN